VGFADDRLVTVGAAVGLCRQNFGVSRRLSGGRCYENASEATCLHGISTTAVSVRLDQGNAFVAYVGDSRLYLVREDRVEQLTEDHSFVARQVKLGALTEEQAKSHRMRNVIYRSLGYQEDVEVDVQVVAVRRGDRFLLCSDGLSGHVEPHEIYDHLAQYGPQEAARRMVDLACDRGGEDNITVVVALVDEA